MNFCVALLLGHPVLPPPPGVRHSTKSITWRFWSAYENVFVVCGRKCSKKSLGSCIITTRLHMLCSLFANFWTKTRWGVFWRWPCACTWIMLKYTFKTFCYELFGLILTFSGATVFKEVSLLPRVPVHILVFLFFSSAGGEPTFDCSSSCYYFKNVVNVDLKGEIIEKFPQEYPFALSYSGWEKFSAPALILLSPISNVVSSL